MIQVEVGLIVPVKIEADDSGVVLFSRQPRWFSSRPKVATFRKTKGQFGELHALKPGKTRITITWGIAGKIQRQATTVEVVKKAKFRFRRKR